MSDFLFKLRSLRLAGERSGDNTDDGGSSMSNPLNDAEINRAKLEVLQEILESQRRCEAKLDRILAKLDLISQSLGEEPSNAAKQVDALKKQLGIGPS